jgi:hypothetical protein
LGDNDFNSYICINDADLDVDLELDLDDDNNVDGNVSIMGVDGDNNRWKLLAQIYGTNVNMSMISTANMNTNTLKFVISIYISYMLCCARCGLLCMYPMCVRCSTQCFVFGVVSFDFRSSIDFLCLFDFGSYLFVLIRSFVRSFVRSFAFVLYVCRVVSVALIAFVCVFVTIVCVSVAALVLVLVLWIVNLCF